MTFGSWISSNWNSFISTILFWRKEETHDAKEEQTIIENMPTELKEEIIDALEDNKIESNEVATIEATINDINDTHQDIELPNKIVSATFHNDLHIIDYEYANGDHICTDYHLNTISCPFEL